MAKIEVRFKRQMSREEMENFKKTWTQPLKDFENSLEYKYGGIQLGDSSLAMYPGNDCVAVYGHNHIHLGDLKADHGCLSKGFYYPILRFYNKLNYEAGFFAYNEGQPNNYDLKFEGDELVLTDENLLELVRKSFEYIQIF